MMSLFVTNVCYQPSDTCTCGASSHYGRAEHAEFEDFKPPPKRKSKHAKARKNRFLARVNSERK